MITGFDSSSAQSQTPNLAGGGFLIVKATEGTTYTNPKMVEQAAHARGLGLVVGFYHFLHPGNVAAQMAYFVKQAASITGDPLFVDWEETEQRVWASCTEKDQALTELHRLRGTTHKTGLYTNLDGWIHHDTTSNCGDALWIADPSSKAGHPGITHPWVIHQYGERNGMDLNTAQFASVTAMRAWATGHPAVKPAPPKPAPKPKPASAPTYIVKEGDTLSSIAEAHDTTWPVLASINHLTNPNHITVGQKLKLK